MTRTERIETERLAKKQRIAAIAHRIIAKEFQRAGFLEDAINTDIEAQRMDECAERLERRLRR